MTLIACSHRRHGQNKTVLSCPCRRCEQAINGPMAVIMRYLFHTKRQHLEPIASNSLKLHPYCQRRKCIVQGSFLEICGLWFFVETTRAIAEVDELLVTTTTTTTTTTTVTITTKIIPVRKLMTRSSMKTVSEMLTKTKKVYIYEGMRIRFMKTRSWGRRISSWWRQTHDEDRGDKDRKRLLERIRCRLENE